jgi:hypothetical protein
MADYYLNKTAAHIDELLEKVEGLDNYDDTEVRGFINNKVDKETGKGLSTNDFTDAYKTELDGLDTALDGKVDKEIGKGLSTNDYTTSEKTKLNGIESGAEVNAQSDWNQTDTTADDYIKNKPVIPDAQIQSDWNQTNTESKDFIKNKPTLGSAASKNYTASVTPDSNNLVTSGAVYSTVSAKADKAQTDALLGTKVDKETGKGLSTNDYTNAEKTKLANLENYDDTEVKASIANVRNTAEEIAQEIEDARGTYTSLGERLDDMGGGGGGTTDYLDLSNKPQINGHELVGDLSPEDLGVQQVQVDWNETAPSAVSYIKNKPEIPAILYGTTESWNSQASLVSQQKTIYVYTDYQVHEGKNIPGFKVGDGITLLINLPFTSSGGGVTDSERESWNNKVTAFIDSEDEENLIFSKD